LNRQILRLAIPNILSNISVPLLSAVDTAVMGHLESPVYLGAIALGSMIFNFIYWGLGFLRMGTTGIAAQAFGAGNISEASSILYRSGILSLLLGAFLLILQIPIAELSFYIIDGSKEVEAYALDYFYIRILAAPATLALYSFHGWFLGVQNAKYPLYLSLFVNFFNIILNLLFVYQFKMKIEGIALATVISQYSGVVFSVVLLARKYSTFIKQFYLDQIIDKIKLKKFFQVNSDIFFRTLLIIFTISFFTTKSAEINDTTLAANFILLQLWLIISYGVDGFAFAAESLTGKYVGADNKQMLERTIKYSFRWGISLGFALSSVYLFLGEAIISLYTSQQEVINTAMAFIFWIIISPVINSVSFIWDGIYLGATVTRPILVSMIISTLLIFLPAFYLSKGYLGDHSIWFALTAFMLIRGLTLSLFRKHIMVNFD